MENYIVEKIKNAILQIDQNLKDIVPKIAYPQFSNLGDFATNVSFLVAKHIGQNPFVVAQNISSHIKTDQVITKIEVAKPGFINFFVSAQAFAQELNSNINLPKTQSNHIAVEFTDPNPFKVFHIGHLFSNTVGEAVARLLESDGTKVTRMCYQGDVGIHVACSIWGMLNLLKITPQSSLDFATAQIQQIQNIPIKDAVAWLGQAYALGATQNKSNLDVAQEIMQINTQVFVSAQKMWLNKDKDFKNLVNYPQFVKSHKFEQNIIDMLYVKGRDMSLQYFESIYQILGTKFAKFYFESNVGEAGYQTVLNNIDNGIFTRSEGAVIFEGEKFGLHTRVLINKHKLPTYEAKELGLNPQKFKDFPDLDSSIIITANEIDEYFKVLLCALSKIAPSVATKTKHISHGFLKLKDGKMSSRTGQVLACDWLIQTVKERLTKKMLETGRIEAQQIDETAQHLAIAAIKYSILRSSFKSDMVFDIDESISLEGNSGLYLLYTIVRIKSVIKKMQVPPKTQIIDTSLLNSHEINVLKYMSRFKSVVDTAKQTLSPHLLCSFANELCQIYNNYYNDIKILDGNNQTLESRHILLNYLENVLTQTCKLLGFKTVSSM